MRLFSIKRRAAVPLRGLRLFFLYVIFLKKPSNSPLPYGDYGYDAQYQNNRFNHDEIFL